MEFMFYHSTFSDGKATLDECDLGRKFFIIFLPILLILLQRYIFIIKIILDESEFKETTLNISAPIMANPKDSFIIKNNKVTFVGNLLNPV